MPLRCIVFDLDGVLVDSWALIQASFHAARRTCGTDAGSLEEFRRRLGRPLPRIAEELGMPEGFVPAYEAASRAHVELAAPYPGAARVLSELSEAGFVLALNTGKGRARTREILGRFGLEEHFAALVCGDDVRHGKPHPEPLIRVAEATGIPTWEMAFVGDSPIDLRCAQGAGAVAIAALWGMCGEEELRAAEPEAVAATLAELPERVYALAGSEELELVESEVSA